jgi:hypothetical protein
MFDDVYERRSWNLDEQRAELLALADAAHGGNPLARRSTGPRPGAAPLGMKRCHR